MVLDKYLTLKALVWELKSPILNVGNKAPGIPLCEKAKKHLAWVLWQCVTAKKKYETLLIQKHRK